MKTLLVIDVQNDFVPEGALAVAGGNEIVPIINRLMPRFDLVIATQDWHPVDHVSFAANHPGHKPGDVIQWHGISQILWPVHCVQETKGAELVSGLESFRITTFFRKGTHQDIDSYSAFSDNHRLALTGLGEFLKQRGVGRIYCLGLTTDYCVKYSALDARSLGLEVRLIADGCRGVNLQPGDTDRALKEMCDAGVEVMTSQHVLNQGVL